MPYVNSTQTDTNQGLVSYNLLHGFLRFEFPKRFALVEFCFGKCYNHKVGDERMENGSKLIKITHHHHRIVKTMTTTNNVKI